MINTVFKDGGVLLTGECIKPSVVFECGQCFRFDADSEGVYTGVAHAHALKVRERDGGLFLYPVTQAEFDAIWRDYFDLSASYADIERGFESDATLAGTVECARGMRLLNQERFETLISFIVSANNNIGRIKKIIVALCERAGESFSCEGREYFAFPTPEAIAALSEEELYACGAGYRAPYIIETARAVADGFDLDSLCGEDYADAKKRLCSLKGVGPKVADCVLLFSCMKRSAFPVDVWMGRVLERMYGFVPKNDREATAFAREHFGEYAGIAQQYLFHYARTNRLI